MREKLIITRNFLYRFFILGFIINLIVQFIFSAAVKTQGVNELSQMLSVSSYYLAQLIISSIVFIRVFLFYFVLLPAIALHWTIARDKHLFRTSIPVETIETIDLE